jgi:SAM-dependent methyltransferase
MRLIDLIHRAPVPEPWAEGEKIPWNEPDFSARMLEEHLTDQHDAASRRASIIDQHVEWIHSSILGGRPGRVLDLGCGPGLYTERLASRGHECGGIDFSPASIAYAEQRARTVGPNCRYVLDDVRRAEFGSGFDLVMIIFGELNVFKPEDASLILSKSRQALNDGAALLLEVHTSDAVRAMGDTRPNWRTSKLGLFSPRPHLILEESFWDEAARVASTRYFVVDAESGLVDRYAESVQAYSDEDYERLLAACGFQIKGKYPSLDGTTSSDDLVVYHAVAV